MTYKFTTDELCQKTPAEIAKIIEKAINQDLDEYHLMRDLLISIKNWLLVIDEKIKA